MPNNNGSLFGLNEDDYRLTEEEYRIYLGLYSKDGEFKLPNTRHDKERMIGAAMQFELGDEFLDDTIVDRDKILNLIRGGSDD